MKKIRWSRVLAVLLTATAVAYGISLAYSEYATQAQEMETLQKLNEVKSEDASGSSPKVETPYTQTTQEHYSQLTPEQKAAYEKSHLMLDDATIQVNKEKIKKGEFTGIKAIVYANSSHVAQWGSNVKEVARIKLSDSDQAKLDLTAAQYAGQEVGFEIEFVDNDCHYTINKFVLGGLQQ